jgi:hypothetical protein
VTKCSPATKQFSQLPPAGLLVILHYTDAIMIEDC